MQAMRAIDRTPLSRSLGLSVNLTRQLETRFFPNSFSLKNLFSALTLPISSPFFHACPQQAILESSTTAPPSPRSHYLRTSSLLPVTRPVLSKIRLTEHNNAHTLALSNPIIALTNTFSGNISQVILRARLRDSDTSPCNSSSFTFLGDSLMGYPSSS